MHKGVSLYNHLTPLATVWPLLKDFYIAESSLLERLILKLDPLLAFNVNISTSVASPLLLVLLLRETLSFGHNEILVSLLCIVIGYICIAS